MKYNITIKDNETGEVVQAFDTNAMIGAIGDGKEMPRGICLAECTASELAGVVVAATRTIDTIVERAKALKLHAMVSEIKQTKTGKVGDSL